MTNQLPATTNTQIQSFAPSLDAKLRDLVLSSDSPVVGPASAAALKAYSETPEPDIATREQIEVMIGKLAIATAQGKTSDAEADARLELFCLALRDLPVEDLRAGFVDLLRSSTFMPTPAEVRAAALKHGAPRRHAKSRARFLAWKHEQEWRPANDIVPAEELTALLASVKFGGE